MLAGVKHPHPAALHHRKPPLARLQLAAVVVGRCRSSDVPFAPLAVTVDLVPPTVTGVSAPDVTAPLVVPFPTATADQRAA